MKRMQFLVFQRALYMFPNLLLGGPTILEDETNVADEDCVHR